MAARRSSPCWPCGLVETGAADAFGLGDAEIALGLRLA